MSALGIAIDGGKFVRINSRLNEPALTVRLTTLKKGQRTARLDFCRFRGGYPHVRKTCLLTDLKPAEDGFSSIVLKIENFSKYVWGVQIQSKGLALEFCRIRTGWGFWPWLALLPVLLAPLLLFFRVSGFAPGRINLLSIKTPQIQSGRMDNSVREKTGEQLSGSEGSSEGLSAGTSAGSPAEPEVIQSRSEAPAVFLKETVIYFEPESALMSPRAKQAAADFLKQVPEGYELIIEGHCADYGTEKGRIALSWERARAVASYSSSLSPSLKLREVQGHGSLYPVSRNYEAQNLNRRVEISAVEITD